MSFLLFLSCFSGHFWSAFLVLLLLAIKRSREPQNLKIQNRDSKSKRDTKNSILISISGNVAVKMSTVQEYGTRKVQDTRKAFKSRNVLGFLGYWTPDSRIDISHTLIATKY